MTGNQRTVLIVEDSADLQRLLASVLSSDGYSVLCANDGQEAIDLLRSSTQLPGVIMLDLMMANIDGYQFRELQSQDPRLAPIPVIIMTADGHIQKKSDKVAAQAYLKKPFTGIDEILQTVDRVYSCP